MPEMAQEVKNMDGITDLSTSAIAEITFQEISRITKGISKETAMQLKKIQELEKRLGELDYGARFFY